MTGSLNSRPAYWLAAAIWTLLATAVVAPHAKALDSFVSVEQFLDMEEEERFSFMIGALDTYSTLGGAGLYRSRDFHMRIDRLMACAHRRPSNRLLNDLTAEAERERTDKAARISMASALPRYLDAICEREPEN